MAYINFDPVALKTARLNAVLSALGANALIKIYTGAWPADPSVAATGTLLATASAASVFGVVTPGVSGGAEPYLTANAIASVNAVATGIPGYVRIETAAGAGLIDVDCGAREDVGRG